MSFLLPEQSICNQQQQTSSQNNIQDQHSIGDLKMESSITKNIPSSNSKNSNIEDLVTQISITQSNYETMKQQYILRIQQLKQELNKKNKEQTKLSQELRILCIEFEEQKKQISRLTRLIQSQIKQNRKQGKKMTMSPKAIATKRQMSPKPIKNCDIQKKNVPISQQLKVFKSQKTNSDVKESSKLSDSNDQNKMKLSNKIKAIKLGAISQKKIDIQQFVYLK